jgi:hypothetical protein
VGHNDTSWDAARDLVILVGKNPQTLLDGLRQTRGQEQIVVFALGKECPTSPADKPFWAHTLVELEASLRALERMPRNVICFPSGGLDAEDPLLGKVRSFAEPILSDEATRRGTRARFGGRWGRNLANNLPLLNHLPTISSLDGIGRGRPAILVSAGPSLDTNIHQLREVQGRAILVANNRAAEALFAKGIRADVVLVSDAMVQFHELEKLDLKQSILALEVSVGPNLFELESPKVTFVANAMYATWLQALFDQPLFVGQRRSGGDLHAESGLSHGMQPAYFGGP